MKLHEMFASDVDAFDDGESITPGSYIGQYLIDNRPQNIQSLFQLSQLCSPIEMYLMGLSVGLHLINKFGIPDDIYEILDYEL
jgi:hypothetical protein